MGERMVKMKLKELKPANYNPRKITDEQLSMLKKALEEFGDLSGIVFNRRTGNLVGGHQRLKCLPEDAKIEKKELNKPSHTGTVAEGFILIPRLDKEGSPKAGVVASSDRLSYREVDWPLEKEKAANIAANKHGGEFDDELLKCLLEELKDTDIELLGFSENELDKLLKEDEEPEINEWDLTDVYIPFWIVIRGPIEKIVKVKELLSKLKDENIKIEASQ